MIRVLRNWLIASLLLIGVAAPAQSYQQTWGPVTATGPLGVARNYRQFGSVPAIYTIDWFNDGTAAGPCTFQVEGSSDGIHWHALTSVIDCTGSDMIHIANKPVMFLRINILSLRQRRHLDSRHLYVHKGWLMKISLFLFLLAAPALSQTSIVSSGTAVIGAGGSSPGSTSLPASAPLIGTHPDGSAYGVTSIPFSMLAGFPTIDPTAAGMTATLGSAACMTSGCQIQIPTTFPFDGFRSAYGNFTGPAETVTDLRGGGIHFTFNDPLPSDFYKDPQAVGMDCYYAKAQPPYLDGGQAAGCLEITSNSSSPGWNNGPAGGLTDGWMNQTALQINMLGQEEGIKGILGWNAYFPGDGDAHIYGYTETNGNCDTNSDECLQGFAMHNDEGSNFYTGVIDSASGETIQTHPTGGGYRDIGMGQRIVQVANPITAGTVRSAVDANDSAANYKIFQIAGGTVTPSKYWCTLDAAINTVPSILPTGSNNIYTPTTFGCTKTGGSGSPAIGDYLNLNVPKPETVRITAVTNPSSDHIHYQITAGLRQNVHPGGMTVYEWAYGRGGLELQGNTMGLGAYDLDVLGATDSTHIVAIQYAPGRSRSPFITGNVDLRSYTLDALSNSGGVVTVLLYIAFPDAKFFGFPSGIVLANSAVTAFNGICSNVRNYTPPPTPGDKASFQCDQSSSNGLYAAYDQGQTMTFNTNNAFTLRRMAAVVDINTYPTGKSPVVSGLLRLEPNTISTATGTVIAMHHLPSMSIKGIEIDTIAEDPYFFGSQLNISANGHSINSSYNFFNITNGEAPSSYAGFGGTMSAPHLIVVTGLFANLIEWGNAPTPGGSLISTGCPPDPQGCNNPSYQYNVFNLHGRITDSSLFFSPYTNALTVNAPSFTMPRFMQVPKTLGSSVCNSSLEGTFLTIIDGSTAVPNTIVTGGGSVHGPIYCDGSNWRSLL